MTINIRYCGGCNPRYDRKKIVQRIQKAFSLHTLLINSQEAADAVVILCGCSSACAVSREDYENPNVFVMWKEEDWYALSDSLERILQK